MSVSPQTILMSDKEDVQIHKHKATIERAKHVKEEQHVMIK